MTADTVTLSDFLLARIAEAEEAARRAGSLPAAWGTYSNDNYGHLLVEPTHVLAECEAKRQVVGLAGEASGDRASVISQFACSTKEEDEMWAEDPGERILRALAMPYADHPDYRDEWRP